MTFLKNPSSPVIQHCIPETLSRANICSADGAICSGCLKIKNRYDIPSSAGWRIWNRRNSFKNNDSISLHSCVAFGRWNIVFEEDVVLRHPPMMKHINLSTYQPLNLSTHQPLNLDLNLSLNLILALPSPVSELKADY